ncbi:ABC transporter B family member 3, partial [Taenia solium]
EVGWFDRPDNQPGTLTGRLAADVPLLQNMASRRLASMLETSGSSSGAEVTRKSVKGASLAQEVFSAPKTVSALQAEE